MNASSIPTHRDTATTDRTEENGPQRVYVASSLHTFNTPRYDVELNRIRTRFPDAAIIPARGRFHSNRAWRRGWPKLLASIDAVVFFADDDGFIGLGVWTELCDADERGIPISYLAPHGEFYDFNDSGDVQVALRPWDWQRFAMIAYTVAIDEAIEQLRKGRR